MGRDVPSFKSNTGFRKQGRVNLRGEVQVLFKGALLLRCEMGKTKTNQRIGSQPVLFDWIVTQVAQTISSVLHALQRGVHLLQKPHEVRVLLMVSHRVFKSKA